MTSHLLTSVALLALAFGPLPVHAGSFRADRKGSFRSRINDTAFRSSIHSAVVEALGCGGQLWHNRLPAIEKALAPTWRSLPKSAGGRIERRSLRYLAQRYFSRQSALLVRGFEPSRPANASGWGDVDILSQQVPAYVESVLESRHAQEHGFDLQDAVHLVAMLEQLISDSDAKLLQDVYRHQDIPTSRSLSQQELRKILEEYLMRWLLYNDREATASLLDKPSRRAGQLPHWKKFTGLALGRIKALEYQRQHHPQTTSRAGHNALSNLYSFEDAHGIVGGITRSFASFWESECAVMKAPLVEMDKHRTGRVPLSKFYSHTPRGSWSFGESESYLRELGALDETSSWRGKQVIIPNYLQAASNCVIATEHYLVCCASACDSLLGELEDAVGGPTAPTGRILAIVANMTSQATAEEDSPPHIDSKLMAQLERIAASHGGSVPLHGRLFAQWLHYAFPRECPFPHKVGTTSATTPKEFGTQWQATEDEMNLHTKVVEDVNISAEPEEEQLHWMSQWSPDEELIADYNLSSTWDPGYRAWALVALAAACGFAGIIGTAKTSATAGQSILPTHGKAHSV